ncbi:MAG: hypothetical protein QE487_00545 [Fluviicola sp.]|nr:hypothetical protein [Fluviicola sp.]
MQQTEEFGITSAGIRDILRKTFNRVFPLILVLVLGGITIPILQEIKMGEKENLDVFDLIPVGIIAVFLLISIFRTKKRLEKIYSGYSLTFENESITRTAPMMPTLTIPFQEITQVKKTAMGGFAVIGSLRLNTLFIPAQVENIERVEELLIAIPTVTITEKSTLLEKLGLPIVLSMLLLFGAFILSDHPVIIISTGTTMCIVLIYSFVIVQKSKMYDQHSKNKSWISLLVMCSILATMYFRVFQ